MYIYTFNPTTSKHLKMPIPIDWTMDDIRFFLNGKAHLSTEKVNLSNIPQTSSINESTKTKKQVKEQAKGQIKESVKESAKESAKEAVKEQANNPVKEQEKQQAKVQPKIIVQPSHPNCATYNKVISSCSMHPTYTGRRLGKNVKDCPTCRILYNKVHAV